MKRATSMAIAILVAFGVSPRASAANITIVRRDTVGTLVGIEGDLDLADGEKFATLVRPLGSTLVLFNSRGGSLLAGLRIGQIIHARGFVTLVPDDDLCASACALAWLGGAQRYLGPKAHLGFHAAYMGDGADAHVSGSGNALVGAYLERLGLSDETIFNLTYAAPDNVLWVNVAAANKLGIETGEFRTDDTPPAAPVRSTTGGVTPRQRALAVTSAYFNAGSSDAATAISWLSSHYGRTIDFYGKPTPLATVLQQKRAFVARWPERIYLPADKTTAVACSPDGALCRVTGTVQFEARSYVRGAYSAGLASFALAVDMRGPRPVVIEESGRVLQRR